MRQSNYKENRQQSSQRKMSDYIKSTLGSNQQIHEPLSNKKNQLNELEYQLQQMVKIKSSLNQFCGLKENKEIRQSKENREILYQLQQQQNNDRQSQLVQTGNFGHPESQLSHRISTQRTLPAFEIHEDIPTIEDLRKLQNQILDLNSFSVEQMDELKKLSSIILFRMRNIRKQ
ncbi:unnamed protein product [Paramecium pentaurelia]|uniref:Uncharacterized protein n=1 Tax=Paramecium pentaurelia TaxID=43138 RepID=A0A8S1T7D8_9CILI|nr:unnamed protein product [Paramecium pentaurelia]